MLFRSGSLRQHTRFARSILIAKDGVCGDDSDNHTDREKRKRVCYGREDKARKRSGSQCGAYHRAKNEIQKLAEGILEQYKLLPGFDLARFLTEQEDFALALQDLDLDTTGMLLINLDEPIRRANSNRLIVINRKLQNQPDFQERRRFIAAHEYGHAKLHASGARYFWHRDTSNVTAPQEQEGEYFARSLLTPEQSVRDLLDMSAAKDGTTQDRASMISRFFVVTKKKARQRMDDLGLA